MEKFAVGVVLGALCGALLVTNNYKMRTLVKKGQDEVTEKLDKLMDEKIDELNEETKRLKEDAKEKTEEIVENVRNVKRSKK